MTTRKENKAYTALDQSSMPNFNSSWVNYKGAWSTTIFVVVALKALFTVIPFITPEASWTLTNLTFNCVSYTVIFDRVKKKKKKESYTYIYIYIYIIIGSLYYVSLGSRFLLSTHYTHYDVFLFGINFTALLVVLIAKLPVMHKVRVFGINKLDYEMD
ncbi:hypothetical protein INT48_007305 [Thamnidium elegans]|uniref:Uncharacterized protein n=1 Tax=Thamnidium elegans TaxID=101142 RepID=A0A8H7VRV0_9FUNG|nr:hypothetical protein INT48_007305 [Thamnidium elegans]